MQSNVSLNHGVDPAEPAHVADLWWAAEWQHHHGHAVRNPMTYAVNMKLGGVDANKMLSAMSSVKRHDLRNARRDDERDLLRLRPLETLRRR